MGTTELAEVAAEAAPDVQPWIKSYYPAFNGLRALAISMVFFSHWIPVSLDGSTLSRFGSPTAFWGFTGVDIFFVLSGFLITGILYDSRFDRGYFRTFYTRRALRIFPLYYCLWLVVFAAVPIFHLDFSGYIFTYLPYLANFFTPGTMLSLHGNPTVVTIFRHGQPEILLHFGVYWSLCVEEQFYLLWPLAVRLMPRRRDLMRACLFVAILVFCLRCLIYLFAGKYAELTSFVYYSSYTRVDTLLTGAWIALWLRGANPSLTSFRRTYRLLFFVPILLLALTLSTAGRHLELSNANPLLATYGYTLLALAAAGLLMACLDERSLVSRMLRNRYLSRLGVISYGFYLFHDLLHFPVLRFVRGYGSGWVRMLVLPVMFLLTYALASLSFRFLETPFLRLKHRLAPGEPKGRGRSRGARGVTRAEASLRCGRERA